MCPASCERDSDCVACPTGNACNNGVCAACSATYPCQNNGTCERDGGICVAPCGSDGEGTCTEDSQCATCTGGATNCDTPIGGGAAGHCTTPPAGCTLAGLNLSLPASIADSVTNTC